MELKKDEMTVEGLTEAFEQTVLQFRADDWFTDPRLFRLLDAYDVEWTINYKPNAVLKRRTEDLLEDVQKQYEQTGTKVTQYRLLDGYRATSWERSRPVVVKVQCGPNDTNRRFVVRSDRLKVPDQAFNFYEQRGICD